MFALLITSVMIAFIISFAYSAGIIWSTTDLPLSEKIKCALFGVLFFFLVLPVPFQSDDGYKLSKSFSLLTFSFICLIFPLTYL